MSDEGTEVKRRGRSRNEPEAAVKETKSTPPAAKKKRAASPKAKVPAKVASESENGEPAAKKAAAQPVKKIRGRGRPPKKTRAAPAKK